MLKQSYNTRSRQLLLPERDNPLASTMPARQFASTAGSRRTSPFAGPRHTAALSPRSTRNVDQPLRLAQTEGPMINDIEREVSDALQAFQQERSKQLTVIDDMRQELKSMRMTERQQTAESHGVSDFLERIKSEREAPKKIRAPASARTLKQPATDGYRTTRAGEEEETVRKLRTELGDTKERLSKKEDELTKQILINKRLSGEIAVLKEKSAVATEGREAEGRAREKLLSLVLGKADNDYIDFKGSVIEDVGLEVLVDNVGKLVDHLVQCRAETEAKYRKLFELHNKLIEINSKRQAPLKAKREIAEEDVECTKEDVCPEPREERAKLRAGDSELVSENERLKSYIEVLENKPHLHGTPIIPPAKPQSPEQEPQEDAPMQSDESKVLKARIIRLDHGLRRFEARRPPVVKKVKISGKLSPAVPDKNEDS